MGILQARHVLFPVAVCIVYLLKQGSRLKSQPPRLLLEKGSHSYGRDGALGLERGCERGSPRAAGLPCPVTFLPCTFPLSHVKTKA